MNEKKGERDCRSKEKGENVIKSKGDKVGSENLRLESFI